MEDFKERMTQLLTIQSSEGIQPDYLFGQHCGHGRQLYFTSYGKEFVNSTLAYLELCKDTRFQSPGLELLQRLFTDGVQWIFYSKQHDPNNAGRFISSNQYSSAIKTLAERIYKLSSSDARNSMKQALQHISGDNSDGKPHVLALRLHGASPQQLHDQLSHDLYPHRRQRSRQW